MKLKILIIFFAAMHYTTASAKEALIETQCNGGVILIQPKIKEVPQGYAIQFVSTSGIHKPYILVNSADDEYKAEIISNIKGNKTIGYIIVKNKEVLSLQFNGCQINWRTK